ncbi:DNA-directed RNA polymerase subunit sigma [Paenibacillus sp. FSL R7-0273]|uniref:sigma-70 family RNA polymerase sigma factor n=1 Tax=Paenibacillus sp. FSL R7-0273 TaxID=1536772 RepID=UPI0004F7A2DD|nr:sigma-70 family RNA polymerase sigma factor [Paenibacillus sp. FSL R7-0273]AIQ48055.1 DNA-directed RNA polymerase subunit sigma [Paenibacillus sp. FSL R7-0273]OMF84713.1 RNA polymerase subunit sigma [Paenibacillus sp. FSL R7-0273]
MVLDAQMAELEELYIHYKRYAFSIAYRMLGSAADAEDIVQDCFADLQRHELSGIDNIKAYVAKSITNRCLNLLNSAHTRRETYIGEWLPEPVSERYDGPEEAAVRKDTLSFAFLVLLERLAPAERAVFVLREAFQYDYEAIAGMVGKSESNCRQIFSRVKRTLQAEPAAAALSPAPGQARRKLLQRFTAAFAAHDVSSMLALLTEQPVLIADGGGQEVHTVLRPMIGRKGVLALLTSHRVLQEMRTWKPSIERVNGEESLVYRREEQVKAVLCLGLSRSGEQIQSFYLTVGPEKLGHIHPRS